MILLFLWLAWSEEPAETPAERGQVKSLTCAGCHGSDGNSATPMWPSLSGQDPVYLSKQLRDFREGRRSDPMMTEVAKQLSDPDIDDIAAWFASQQRSPVVVDAVAARLGEQYYRYGWPDQGRVGCMGCHGSRGLGFRGVIPSGFPPIGSQHAGYTARQLSNFRAGVRTNDYNGMMRNATARLTDAEITALSAYIASLTANPPRVVTASAAPSPAPR